MRLREVGPDDLAALTAIGPDREAWLAYGGDPARDPVGGEPWARTILDRLTTAPWGRVIERDGHLAGEIRLHGLTQDNSARLALGLFRATDRGQGLGRAAISLALDHAFGPLGLHRVALHVLATNTRAIRCYEGAGFRHEGRLREAARIGGGYQDDLVMAILATDPRPRPSFGHVPPFPSP